MLTGEPEEIVVDNMDILGSTTKPEIIIYWFHTYGDYLFSWAYHKTGNCEVVEDLVQEFFLSAVKNFAGFQEKTVQKPGS